MIAPRKSLGQNFLRDENVARKIVEHLNPKRDDILLEIGPGTGALTEHLAGTVRSFIAVEIDERSMELLRGRFQNVEFLLKDILEVRLRDIHDRFGRKIRIAGNIPYYITSEILFWLLDQRLWVEDALLMMQWEVARRLTARPRTKDYGILSVVTQLYAAPAIAFRVSRNSFFPRPAVDSAIVHLQIRPHVSLHDEQLLRNVVRGTFGKRRKTLMNGLKYMGYAEDRLKSLDFDLGRRPEELSVDEFLELTSKLGTPAAGRKMSTLPQDQ
ncbi:MAG TPA: 16S rRNA (adenine(1518)-N(6)/adenine(1519)-N(6))-dimethyltransferase RsmA [Bacteroidota bacterium]